MSLRRRDRPQVPDLRSVELASKAISSRASVTARSRAQGRALVSKPPASDAGGVPDAVTICFGDCEPRRCAPRCPPSLCRPREPGCRADATAAGPGRNRRQRDPIGGCVHRQRHSPDRARGACWSRRDKDLVYRRGEGRPADQDHPPLGPARHPAVRITGPAHGLDRHLRRDLPGDKRHGRARAALVQHRSDGPAPGRDQPKGAAGQALRGAGGSGRMTHRSGQGLSPRTLGLKSRAVRATH